MADFIYTTPTGTCAIIVRHDPEWETIFFLDNVGYNICINEQDSGEMENLSGWRIIDWKATLIDAFDWLLNHKRISQDEYEFQISKIRGATNGGSNSA